MSSKGVIITAGVFDFIQQERHRLLKGDTQDIELGQLLDKMKDLVKEDFIRIIDRKPKPTKFNKTNALQ